MSKLSDSYRTPPDLFNALNEVTPFFWDGCCNKDNCLLKKPNYENLYGFPNYDYLTKDFSELRNREDMKDLSIFINPPYSRGSVGPIIKKAWEDAKHFRVVMLLKADMSTDWFNYVITQNNCENSGRHKAPEIPVQINQMEGESLIQAYTAVLHYMKLKTDGSKSMAANHVGILHLRKRVKFLADEEMMVADKEQWIDQVFHHTEDGLKDTMVDRNAYENGKLLETKNFKRSDSDGGLIYPKSGPTFPSMLLIMDRRT